MWPEGPEVDDHPDTFKWKFKLTFSEDLYQTIGYEQNNYDKSGKLLRTRTDKEELTFHGLCLK